MINIPKEIVPLLKTFAKERGEDLDTAVENALYAGMSRLRALARYAAKGQAKKTPKKAPKKDGRRG